MVEEDGEVEEPQSREDIVKKAVRKKKKKKSPRRRKSPSPTRGPLVIHRPARWAKYLIPGQSLVHL
jgi:hypothetical protein